MNDSAVLSPSMERAAEEALLEFQQTKGDMALARDAVMTQDLSRMTTRYEEQARAADAMLMGEQQQAGEPMGDISIRSPVNHHYYPPPAPPQPAAPPPASGMGTLAKVALGTALVAGGGGLGFLASQWAGRAEMPPANTSNNTGFNLKFVE